MNHRKLLCLAFLFSGVFARNASAQTDTCSNYLVALVVFANLTLQLAAPNFAVGKRNLKIAALSGGQDRLKHAQFFYPWELYKCLPQTVSTR